jgi:hypothetical protein
MKRASRYAATTKLKRNAADELFTKPSKFFHHGKTSQIKNSNFFAETGLLLSPIQNFPQGNVYWSSQSVGKDKISL